MVGWTIFGAVLGFTALAFHEERGRQILIGMLFVLVCASVTALTDSLAWGIIFGGISALALSFKIYLNQMARESEAREREKYNREAEARRREQELCKGFYKVPEMISEGAYKITNITDDYYWMKIVSGGSAENFSCQLDANESACIYLEDGKVLTLGGIAEVVPYKSEV